MTPEEITKLQTDLGWTLERFGSALGVSFAAVSRWEHGHARPTPIQIATMRRMREQLDARVAGLSTGIDVGNDWKTILLVGGLLAFLVVVFSESE